MKFKYLLFKLGIAIAFIGLICPIAATGQTLMHSYDFETNLTDGTGTADATANGGASVSGGGLVLDANGKYVSFDGTALGLDSYGSITMEYIFVGSAAANTAWNWTGYFGDDAGANNLRNSLGHWNDEIRTAYNGSTILLDGQDVNNGNMHHIVVVLKQDSLLHYEDGTLRAGIAIGIDSIGTAQSYLGRGCDAWGGDPTWQGVIYDFNIYDGELTADSVAKRAYAYLSPSSSVLTDITSTVGTMLFDGDTSAFLIVPIGTVSLDLTATPYGDGATVDVDGQGSASATITIPSLPDTIIIDVTSEDATSTSAYTVVIIGDDLSCYTPYYTDRTNLIADPTFSAPTLADGGFGGWGPTGLVTDDAAYCGNASAFIRGSCWPNGGSMDRSLNSANVNALKANSAYRLRAMINSQAAPGTVFQIQVEGVNGASSIYFDIDTTNGWEQFDTVFTTGSTIVQKGIYFNSCSNDRGLVSPAIEDSCFIDNYELYEVNNDGTLSDLTISWGTLAPAFSPGVFNYSVVTHVDSTSIDVTATKNEATAVMTGDGTISLTNGEGTAEVVVTPESGIVNTYTISFSPTLSNDSTLSDLSIDETHIMTPDFDPAVFDYDVIVAKGTDTVTISATTNHAGATITAMDTTVDVSSGSAIATIVVLAQNGTAQSTYTVNIAYEDTSCFTPLYSDGRTNYIPDPLLNSIDEIGGWGLKSVIIGDSAYCGLSAALLTDATGGGCTAALDIAGFVWKSNTIYRVRAMVKTVSGSIGILARGSRNNDGADFGFAFNTQGGWVELDTTFMTGTAARTGFFSFNTCDFGSNCTATYIDNYELYEVYTYSSDATLSDLRVNDTTVADFNPNTLSYVVVLPVGTTDVPVVTATANNDSADVDVTNATSLPDTAIIVVTAENGVSMNTYSVIFTIGDAVANLAARSIMLYPTVSDGIFTVETNALSSVIKVYDIQGKLVLQQVGGDKQTISLTHAGMYFVRVECNEVSRIFKVIRTN